MAPAIEKLPIPSLIVGQGPYWDVASQSLLLFDIVAAIILRYDRNKNETFQTKLELPCVNFLVPVEGKNDEYVIGSEHKLYLLKWDGISENIGSNETLYQIKPDSEHHKISDAKCDSKGRIWFGTYSPTHLPLTESPATCKIYSYTKQDGVHEHAGNIRVSNGLCFDLEEKYLYHIDTTSRTVDLYDFNVTNKTLENRRTLFDFEKNNMSSFPNGMTIDKDGNLWVACYNGSQVVHISKSGELIKKIDFPTPQITSVAWGGPELSELYVTSGNANIEEDGEFVRNEKGDANAGCVYRVTGLETNGVPIKKFKM